MLRTEAEIAQVLRYYQARTGRVLTICTVESATGGRIADRITNMSGSSDYFLGSVVSYSDQVKVATIGVTRATLDSHGAVSEQTALEMAHGGRKLLGADVCVSDTGIAGPTGDSPGKPVGLFYLGLAAEDASLCQRHQFSLDREQNKRDAAQAALDMLKDYLLERVAGIQNTE